MKVLNASHLSDTGGNGYRTKVAFQHLLPSWTYRVSCRTTNYIDYPQDIPWSQALRYWNHSDVVHVRDGFHAQQRLGAPDRPTVIHHHGTQFRKHRAVLLREQRRRHAKGLAATLDLYLDAPSELEWMPALYDLEMLAQLSRQGVREGGAIRIGHAPTNRRIKSTDAFLAACDKLGQEVPIQVVLIEKKPWRECLELKSTCHIYFDQVLLGYGNNAIEAWGMGLPVIAGGEERTLREMERRFGSLPFMLADEGSIYDALSVLVDAEARSGWAARGLDHVRQWHSEEAVVPMLRKVYEEVAR